MLRFAHRLSQISFEELMAVYKEGNLEKAREKFSFLEPEQALMLVEGEFEDYLRRDFFSVPGACYALWEEGQLCSALRLEPYQDGFLVCALETRPELRRMGYGGKLMRGVQAAQGFDKLYSHVSRTNLPSQALHKSCGFRVIGDFARFLDGSVNSHCQTLLWER